uniref:Uncharacterized protein n=1 Tax=Anguilla anguilla TaxID=7936 RepID=A0A0E9UPQ0_ANGAN
MEANYGCKSHFCAIGFQFKSRYTPYYDFEDRV